MSPEIIATGVYRRIWSEEVQKVCEGKRRIRGYNGHFAFD